MRLTHSLKKVYNPIGKKWIETKNALKRNKLIKK